MPTRAELGPLELEPLWYRDLFKLLELSPESSLPSWLRHHLQTPTARARNRSSKRLAKVVSSMGGPIESTLHQWRVVLPSCWLSLISEWLTTDGEPGTASSRPRL